MTKNGKYVKISVDLLHDNKTNLNCYYAVKGSTKMEEIAKIDSLSHGLDIYICLDEDLPDDFPFPIPMDEKMLLQEQKNKTKMMNTTYENATVSNSLPQEMNVKLSFAANYLIKLFYYTGKRYTCTRTKLGKLLSIAAFAYARAGKKLFEETIYKYHDCGTGISGLQLYDRDIYTQEQYYDDSEKISTNSIDFSLVIPDVYVPEDLPKDVKGVLTDVFCEFGSFPALQLGEYINSFLKDIIDDLDNNIVDLSKMSSVSENVFTFKSKHICS